MAPCTAGTSLDTVLSVETLVQQLITTLNASESEEEE
jgi:hypothetical protein